MRWGAMGEGMRRRGLGSLAILALALAALALAAGCGDDPERDAARRKAQAAKADRASAAAKAKAAAAAAAEAAAKNIYRFTEAPDFESIPAQPAVGRLDERPIEVAQVVLEPGPEGWILRLLDVKLPYPTALARGSHPLEISLGAEPLSSGQRFSRPLQAGGARWARPPAADAPADAPAGAVIWRPELGFAVELTTVELQPYAADGPAFQAAGTASGRLAVVLRDGERTAWVAGSFEGAIIRYMGRPAFETVPPPPPPPEEQPKPRRRRR